MKKTCLLMSNLLFFLPKSSKLFAREIHTWYILCILRIGVELVDMSVRVFGRIFPKAAAKHKYQMIQHFKVNLLIFSLIFFYIHLYSLLLTFIHFYSLLFTYIHFYSFIFTYIHLYSLIFTYFIYFIYFTFIHLFLLIFTNIH